MSQEGEEAAPGGMCSGPEERLGGWGGRRCKFGGGGGGVVVKKWGNKELRDGEVQLEKQQGLPGLLCGMGLGVNRASRGLCSEIFCNNSIFFPIWPYTTLIQIINV